MARTTFKFEGGKELEAALQGLGNKATIKRAAERGLQAAATPIRDEWARLVPEDQGDLKRSVKIGRAISAFQRRSRGDTVMTFVGIDESEDARLHIYAEVQEFGNEDYPAQPAGRPAWDSQKEVARDRLAADLWQAIVETPEVEAASKAARKKSRAGI